jgi:hypothetical protein
MTNPLMDLVLDIRNLINTDREAMISTGLTSLNPAVELMGDHLKFIDENLTNLTNKD